jgi:hypothetical protein
MATDDELKAEIERLKKENESLKLKKSTGISMKVSQKGALSLYGLGRWPVTLYKSQWLRVAEDIDKVLDFIEEHKDELQDRQ